MAVDESKEGEEREKLTVNVLPRRLDFKIYARRMGRSRRGRTKEKRKKGKLKKRISDSGSIDDLEWEYFGIAC